MGNIRLYGSTSGYTELAPPAVAPDGVLSLPSGTGTLLTAEGGKVLQVVRATDATARTTTSTTFTDATGMSVTITPQKNTSAILIIATFTAQNSWQTLDVGYSQFIITDSSNTTISGGGTSYFGALNLSGSGARNLFSPITLIGYSTPATISATTYKMRFKSETANVTTALKNNDQTGQMFAIEVSA